jgi:hypothetical protein
MAMTNGAHTVNVRKILLELGITNRVFYNRFRNVDDVLGIVYQKVSEKIRASASWESNSQEEFFERVTDMVANTLISSYDLKKQFNHYMFENDSRSQSNYKWWMSTIKQMFAYAKEKRYIRTDADVDVLSYSTKEFGFNQAIRTLNPDYVVTDELMTKTDVNSLISTIYGGVEVIATVHSESINSLKRRSYFSNIFKYKPFNYYVLICFENSSRVYKIYDKDFNEICFY